MQKLNVPHAPVQMPTERMPFFSKFKQKIALGLTLLTVGQLAAPVVFRKFSPFAENAIVRAEEKKEELKSILEKEPRKKFTVEEGNIKVTAINSSCRLVIKTPNEKLKYIPSEVKAEEKIVEFQCHDALIFSDKEKFVIAVLGAYRLEGEKERSVGLLLLSKEPSFIVQISSKTTSILKYKPDRIAIKDTRGDLEIYTFDGELKVGETKVANGWKD